MKPNPKQIWSKLNFPFHKWIQQRMAYYFQIRLSFLVSEIKPNIIWILQKLKVDLHLKIAGFWPNSSSFIPFSWFVFKIKLFSLYNETTLFTMVIIIIHKIIIDGFVIQYWSIKSIDCYFLWKFLTGMNILDIIFWMSLWFIMCLSD